MKVQIDCWRSLALAERGVWTSSEEKITLGPYEYVELTYDSLRVSPNGDWLGQIENGDWYINDHDEPFSDICIYAVGD